MKINLLPFLILSFAIAGTASATVGGPSYVNGISSDVEVAGDQPKFIYATQDFGGRGCPPEIHLVDIVSNTDKIIVSCDEAESDFEAYQEKFAQTLRNYPRALDRIDLNKNKISADISVEKIITEDSERGVFAAGAEFRAMFFQEKDKLLEITYSGCSADQPHIIEGYTMKQANFLVLLLSAKSDCFEGGYIKEKVYLLKGVKLLDANPLQIKRWGEPASPDAGNLVLYADSGAEVPGDGEENGVLNRNYILIALAILLLGISSGAKSS